MPFKKGDPKPPTSGRKTGTVNKFTGTVKETVLAVFNAIQSDPKVNLTAFAKKYPRDFYNLAGKLIPTEITGKDGKDFMPKNITQLNDEQLRDLVTRARNAGAGDAPAGDPLLAD